MTVPDSPENKCPDECPECGSEKRWPPPVWTDGESGVTEECWHPWHEKPRCPDCGGSGANEFGDAFNNPCQTCGGSGRINTSGGGKTDEELARVTRAAVKGPDGYDYHWCPGVGWCPGCPPSAVPKEEA